MLLVLRQVDFIGWIISTVLKIHLKLPHDRTRHDTFRYICSTTLQLFSLLSYTYTLSAFTVR